MTFLLGIFTGTVQCTTDNDANGSTPQFLIADTFKYVLWKFKKRKKIPNFPTFIDKVFFIIRSAAQMSPKIEFGINNNNIIANFFQARG